MNVLLLIYIDSNPRSTLGTRDFFSRVTRSFVSCRATRLRPEDETETGNRAWKVSGTQGIHAVALQIKCDYYFSSFRNSIKVSKLVAQKSPHKAFQSNFISLKTYLSDILLFSFAILIITLFTHLFTFGDFDFWLVKGSSKRNCVITKLRLSENHSTTAPIYFLVIQLVQIWTRGTRYQKAMEDSPQYTHAAHS